MTRKPTQVIAWIGGFLALMIYAALSWASMLENVSPDWVQVVLVLLLSAGTAYGYVSLIGYAYKDKK